MIYKVFAFLGRSTEKQQKAGFYDHISDLFSLGPKIGH